MGAHRQGRGRRAATRAELRAARRRERDEARHQARHGAHLPPTGGRRVARPRYDRMAAAGLSLVITAVALLAGIGVIPIGGGTSLASASGALPDDAPEPGRPSPSAPATPRSSPAEASGSTLTAAPSEPASPSASPSRTGSTKLPADSGTGRRVVFSITEQRIWLVEDGDRVVATHLASGSLTDNLRPGTYEVYSRSRHAIGIEDSGTMEYFVRFTRGENAAIGFHSIPVKDGEPLQTEAQLGTPQSHGCIRQAYADAKRLWDFAPDGTTVVVTA